MRLWKRILLFSTLGFGAYLGFAALSCACFWFKTGGYDYEKARQKVEKMFIAKYNGEFRWKRFIRYALQVFKEAEARAKNKELYRFFPGLELHYEMARILVFLRDSRIQGDITPLVPFLKKWVKNYPWLPSTTGGTFGLWPFKGYWTGRGPCIPILSKEVLQRYGIKLSSTEGENTAEHPIG